RNGVPAAVADVSGAGWEATLRGRPGLPRHDHTPTPATGTSSLGGGGRHSAGTGSSPAGVSGRPRCRDSNDTLSVPLERHAPLSVAASDRLACQAVSAIAHQP